MHCEKSSTSQIGIYSLRIWTLNAQCYHREIGKIAIRKDFPIKFFHKKHFHDNLKKQKANSFSSIDFFFYKNKMILAHRALYFFPCSAKLEINLTLPNFCPWRHQHNFITWIKSHWPKFGNCSIFMREVIVTSIL